MIIVLFSIHTHSNSWRSPYYVISISIIRDNSNCRYILARDIAGCAANMLACLQLETCVTTLLHIVTCMRIHNQACIKAIPSNIHHPCCCPVLSTRPCARTPCAALPVSCLAVSRQCVICRAAFLIWCSRFHGLLQEGTGPTRPI